METLRTCQVVASINRNTGGTAVSVPRLASELAALGVASKLLTLDYSALGPQAGALGVTVVSVPADIVARRLRGFCPAARRGLYGVCDQGIDLIHNHGLWMFPNKYARMAASNCRVPLIISPRGMLSDWALRRGRLKKFFVWHAFEKNNMRAARMFHATSEEEAAELRGLGFCQPVAVIPNGVDIEELSGMPPRTRLEARFPELRGRQWLLFLSRLHPKKGLAELIGAWRGLQERFPDWHLIIAGPDLDGYRPALDLRVAESGLAGRVTFAGMLADDDKRAALGHAGLFVLPTHSENFGIVIAEALTFGVPVVTTKAAPWAELESEHCGWWIEDDEQSLTAALNVALQTRADERAAMGQRGRFLMERKYSWRLASEKMLAAYLWCCGRGERPSCVRNQ